jgi:hypothetical protein
VASAIAVVTSRAWMPVVRSVNVADVTATTDVGGNIAPDAAAIPETQALIGLVVAGSGVDEVILVLAHERHDVSGARQLLGVPLRSGWVSLRRSSTADCFPLDVQHPLIASNR